MSLPQMERYTQELPQELTYEVALRRPWRDLYATYQSLPEYRQAANNPNHHLWKDLYHHNLSSYDLPPGANYRDQYFWGMRIVDRALHNQQFGTLAELGYDQALIKIYNQLVRNNQLQIERLNRALDTAIKKDYLTIVEFLLPTILNVDPAQIIVDTVLTGHRDIIDYLVSTYGPLRELDWGHHMPAARAAALSGRRDLMWYLIELTGYSDYCQLRDDSALSDNTSLFDELNRLCDVELDADRINRLLEYVVEKVKMFYHLHRLLPAGTPIDAEDLMRVAVQDCDLNALQHAFDLGDRPSSFQADLLDENCHQPALHRWLIENTDIWPSLPNVAAHQTPEIITMYFDATEEPIDEELAAEILPVLLSNEKPLALIKRLLERSPIAESYIAEELLFYLIDRPVVNEIVEYLAAKLGYSDVGMSVPQLLDELLSQYELTPDSYARLIMAAFREPESDLSRDTLQAIIPHVPLDKRSNTVHRLNELKMDPDYVSTRFRDAEFARLILQLEFDQ